MAGIYVHIPFCHAKCAYCDFFSTPRRHDARAFVDAVIAEYEARRYAELRGPVRTVYFGGGTPSSLPLPELERLIGHFAGLNPVEFTVEVNPEDIDSTLVSMLAASGVNRVSMGVQSLDGEQLKLVGRRHSPAQAIEAFQTLREGGITNICLDLIYGLPGQSLDSWKDSLDRLIALRPEHLSCYALSYEPGTRLWAMLQTGKVREASQELSETMYAFLCRRTAQCGYGHYEIANFALAGRESLHNSNYWNFTPYLGLGPGAHSFDGNTRRYNPNDIAGYISNPTGFAVVDPESETDMLNDCIMMALRTARGIDLGYIRERFGEAEAERLQKIALTDERYQPTPTGFRIAEDSWLLADPLTIRMMKD